MQVPYNALIIAHERMHIFAYVSIVEAILKLLVVYLLLVISFDKLIIYGILMFLVSLTIASYYRIYVMRNYEESHFSLSFDKEIVKSMLQFSAWNLFGTLGAMFSNHGVSLLLNLYFGPVANAAHAISMQVSGGLNQFVNSFQTAMTPQITKLYAANKIDELNNFLYQNTKYAIFIALDRCIADCFKVRLCFIAVVDTNTSKYNDLYKITYDLWSDVFFYTSNGDGDTSYRKSQRYSNECWNIINFSFADFMGFIRK